MELALPERKVVELEPRMFLMQAKALVITEHEEYNMAADDLKRIKAKAKELDEQRKALTKPLDDQKREVMEFYRPATEFLTEAEKILKGAMATWQAEQERIAAVERARAAAAAAAEQQRLRDEAAALAKQAEEAAKSGDAEAAFAAQVEAEERLAVAEVVTANPVAEPAKQSGISYRSTWNAEVTNIVKLCEFVVANPNMAHLVEPNMTDLRKMAIAMRENLNIPGVKAVELKTVAVR